MVIGHPTVTFTSVSKLNPLHFQKYYSERIFCLKHFKLYIETKFSKTIILTAQLI